MTVWRMRIACWIPKATNTQLEYVILIVFPLQQWLHQSALSVLSAVMFFTFTTSWSANTVLCSTEPFCAVLNRSVQYWTVLCSTEPFCAVLNRSVQYCTVLCSTEPFCAVLNRSVQYWITNKIFQYPALSNKCQFNSNMDDISTASFGHFDLNDTERLQNPNTCFGYDL